MASSVIVNSSDDTKVEEVTETRIIGVTSEGIVRKRSFKRRVSMEEKPRSCSYGNDHAEYEKIRHRVISDKSVSSNLEALQERWKMVKMMYGDCQDLVSQWELTRQKRSHLARTRDMYVLGIVCISLLFVISWTLVKY